MPVETQRLKCPTCREAVAQLELVPNIGERVESYEAAAQPGVLSYEGVPVFLQAMFNSAAQEVADAARTAHDHWGKPDEGKLEAELRNAAEEGNTEAVRALLATPGVDVNAANGYGYTALVLAAGRGHAETVTALLAAPGLDVNAADGDGYTALMRAAARGHAGTVTALLAAPGLDVNAATGAGYTALVMAAARGHAETVTALLATPGLDMNAADVVMALRHSPSRTCKDTLKLLPFSVRVPVDLSGLAVAQISSRL